MNNNITLLRMPDLTKQLGIARSTIYKLMSQGDFPKPIKLTRRAVAWRESDVAAYLVKRSQNS